MNWNVRSMHRIFKRIVSILLLYRHRRRSLDVPIKVRKLKYAHFIWWYIYIYMYRMNIGLIRWFIMVSNIKSITKRVRTWFLSYPVPVRVIWAVKGKDVDLPCDITTTTPGDYPKLILWFKDTTGIPLYRYGIFVDWLAHKSPFDCWFVDVCECVRVWVFVYVWEWVCEMNE